MMCSPSGLSRTVSGAVFPSPPGAPLGQSFIGVCCADAKPNAEQINSTVSMLRNFLAVRKRVLPFQRVILIKYHVEVVPPSCTFQPHRCRPPAHPATPPKNQAQAGIHGTPTKVGIARLAGHICFVTVH